MGTKEKETLNVSFTDTTAETGAMGKGKGGETSNMMTLLGSLKQKKGRGSAESKSYVSLRSQRKKKKKKKGKYEYKLKRRKDKYESANYLFRVEGTPCCAALIVVGLGLGTILVILVWVILWSKGAMDAIFNKHPQ